MQAYMKSAMPFYGVTSPQVDAVCKKVFAENPFPSCDEWQAAILELWRGARYREERYVAIRLVSVKRHRECWSPDLMPMLEEMIVTGAWWDYEDELAHVVGLTALAREEQGGRCFGRCHLPNVARGRGPGYRFRHHSPRSGGRWGNYGGCGG